MTAEFDTVDAIVTLEHIEKRFGPRRRSFAAVKDATLALGPSSRIGIVGESGSGKSTLSRMIAGLETPSSGRVSFRGQPLAEVLRKPATRLQFRREVQFIGQDTSASFDPLLTLRESVRTPAEILLGLNRADANDRVDQVLADLGITPDMADRKPAHVSGGQRQRFAIARAVIVEPLLLICDEVVSALDVSVQGQVLNYLKLYCASNNAGLVFVSHGLPATAFIAEELVVMLHGDIVERGSVDAILSDAQHPYTRALLAAYESAAGDALIPVGAK